MITSINGLIEENGHELKDMVYRSEKKEVLSFPLTAGNFFELQKGLEKGRSFAAIYAFYCAFCERQEQSEVPELLGIMGELNRLSTSTKKEDMVRLKRAKKYVRQKTLDCVRQCYDETVKEFGLDPETLLYFEYKNRAVVTSFYHICSIIPALLKVDVKELYQMPVLATDLSKLKTALDNKEMFGLVGGPCLFGVDEVLLQLTTEDGEIKYFDCSGGRNASQEKEPECTLEEYLTRNNGRIKDIDVVNRKKGITKQEHRSLLYLFEFAAALGGKVIVPLPDMSYLKYMSCDLQLLNQPLFDKAMELFKEEAYKITDLFLEVIEIMRRRYPGLDVTVLHQRDKKLCEDFYEKRAPFIRDSSYMRKLTDVSGKKEAVVDYITMLALPYYLFGIRNIIQVDSLDETDSGRKCQKIHKENFTLHSILFPELISGDGVNTIYNADILHKEYLKKEDY